MKSTSESKSPSGARPASPLERLCREKGLKMTHQRRVIARVLSESEDHPAAEDVYERASRIEPKVSIATVYRTIRLLEEAKVLDRLDFGDGRARYERSAREHHDHLIDTASGKVIEFVSPEIERLQEKVARDLGYRLTGHRHELYGVPLARGRAGGIGSKGGR